MSKKQKKGGFESKYDAQKLRDLIQSGASADQIQKELGVVSRQSLRQHILKLINTDRQFYDVPNLYVRNVARPQVNFKGEVRLTKKMLDFPGTTYKHGDQFEIDIDNERIVMTRIVDTPNGGDVADEATEEPEGE